MTRHAGRRVVHSTSRVSHRCVLVWNCARLFPIFTSFPDATSWSVHLRRPLVPLDEHDRALLKCHLIRLLESPGDHVGAYQQAAEKRHI